MVGKHTFYKNACLCHTDRGETALKYLKIEVQAKSDSASASCKCTVTDSSKQWDLETVQLSVGGGCPGLIQKVCV